MTVFAQQKIKRGRNASDELGIVQSVSNIDAENFRSLGEVFVEQRLLDDRLRVRVGRMDFNTEYAATDHGGDFLNASMGFSPSVTGAPTYPLPSNGASIVVTPRPSLGVAFGAFDGTAGAPRGESGASQFLIGQLNVGWAREGERHAGRLGVGRFHHSGSFARVGNSEAREHEAEEPGAVLGTGGWYATMDQEIFRGVVGADGESSAIAAFVQLGRSDRHVDAIREHVGGGIVMSGLRTGVRRSAIGIGTTHAAWRGGSESIGEFYHHWPLLKGLTLISDVQRVRQVDVVGGRRVGNIFTLRTIVSF